MFPPEIWKECFEDSPKQGLKILSVLSKECNSIFQPLFYREMNFFWTSPDKIRDGWQRHLEDSVHNHFRIWPDAPVERSTWEEYLARIIRGAERFKLVSRDPRLAAFVRRCAIEGPGSRYPTLRPADNASLTGVIYGQYRLAVETMSNALPCFSNLRQLAIKDTDITRAMLRHIEQAPRLEELTFKQCVFAEAPGAFSPPSLSKFTVVLGEYCIRLNPDQGPKPLWAAQVASILPTKTLEELKVQAYTSGRYPELQIYRPLENVGVFPCLESLSVPIPSNRADAKALIGALKNCPALRFLDLQDPAADFYSRVWSDKQVPFYHIPHVSSSACPLLERLVAPIFWAQDLVPGRPIRILTVFRTMTHDADFEDVYYETYNLREVLEDLADTSTHIEELTLPFIEDKNGEPILGMIGHLFPRVKTLDLILPDAGLESAPKVTPPPSPLLRAMRAEDPDDSEPTTISFPVGEPYVFRPPLPFVPPSPQEIHDALVQIHLDVGADLANVPKDVYKMVKPAEKPFYIAMYDSTNEWRSVEWDEVYPNDTFSGAIRYAATHPEKWPLPPSITTLHLTQHSIPEGRHGTPFYRHQQEKVLEQLSAQYPYLREVIWRYETTVGRFRHRWWCVDGKWELKPSKKELTIKSPF